MNEKQNNNSYKNPHKEGCQQRYRLDGICSCGMDDQDILSRANQIKQSDSTSVSREETLQWIDENGRADWPLHYNGFTERLARAYIALLDSSE